MRWTAIDELTTGLACWLQIAEHIYNPPQSVLYFYLCPAEEEE